ncbi:hypothetical protein [Glaciihabitans sp. dw_435]|uniref:hypothetical protein n=1 Tax=Glaciihabitans sp. dw_435 TaxID=2720081 RepID=UPI001BD3A7C7|nr:hypothetical protein [Glaciihabitans sp. dw_435]
MSTSEPQPTEPDTTNTQARTQPTDALTRELPAQDDAETLQLWATSPGAGASTDTAAPVTAPADAAAGTAAAAAAASTQPQPQPRLRVRVGTIVWGVVLLVIAGLARVATLIDPADYTPTFIIWSVIGFGGLLVIAGVAAAVVKAVTRRPGAARWE